MNMTDSFVETSRELEGVHLAVERMETCAMRYCTEPLSARRPPRICNLFVL